MTRKVKRVRVADVWHIWPEDRPQDNRWIMILDNRFGKIIGKYNPKKPGIVTPEHIEHRFGAGRILWKIMPDDMLIRIKDGRLLEADEMPLGYVWRSMKDEPPKIGELILIAEKNDNGWHTWVRPVTANGYCIWQGEKRALQWCKVTLPKEEKP